MKRARRPLAPLPNSRGPVRLWPRVRPINRHIVERSLRVAAFGAGCWRTTAAGRTWQAELTAALASVKGGEASH